MSGERENLTTRGMEDDSCANETLRYRRACAAHSLGDPAGGERIGQGISLKERVDLRLRADKWIGEGAPRLTDSGDAMAAVAREEGDDEEDNLAFRDRFNFRLLHLPSLRRVGAGEGDRSR